MTTSWSPLHIGFWFLLWNRGWKYIWTYKPKIILVKNCFSFWAIFLERSVAARRCACFYTSFTFWDSREKRIFENYHLRLKGLSPWKNNFTVGFVAFFPTTFPSSLFCYDQPNLRKSGFCVFSYVFNAKFKTSQKPYYLISTCKT